MGRYLYLERLALGRSAFEDPPPLAGDGDREDSEHINHETDAVDNAYRQHYNDKGRPINLATEKFKQDLRHAQNTILSLVNVVERKETGISLKYKDVAEQREIVLKLEHERGEELDLAKVFIDNAFTYFPQTLTARIRAGMYNLSVPFATTVLNELGLFSQQGWRGTLAILFPGTLAFMLHGLAGMLLYEASQDAVSWAMTEIRKYFPHQEQVNQFDRLTSAIIDLVFTAVDVALLPLRYHACAQMLGLAPAWPLLPNYRTLLPMSPLSYHHFLWQPLLGQGPLRYTTSPAVLILGLNLLTRDSDEERPVASKFTSFRYPHINWPPPSRKLIAEWQRNPLDTVLYHLFDVRRKVLSWFGYNLRLFGHQTDLPYDELQNHYLSGYKPPADEEDRHHIWRSTSLSLMPVSYLAERIDAFFSHFLILGLESTVYRAITSSYLMSPLPKTALAIGALHNYTRAPSDRLAPFGSWAPGRDYLSKLGLGLAFCCAAEVTTFFAIYGLARWQGRRNFDWDHDRRPGPWRKIGSVLYSKNMTDEDEH